MLSTLLKLFCISVVLVFNKETEGGKGGGG